MIKERLQKQKDRKIALIKDYDKSQAVNSFLVNGRRAWLDKATRVGLINSLQIEKAAERTESQLWFDGVPYIVPIDKALQMLMAIELYAIECFNNTERHLASVERITDPNRVWNYNYTIGYPRRLEFVL